MTEEQVGAIALGVAAITLGPLVWWLTRRASTGDLRRNPWAGLRTSRTMQSDEAWLTGHRAAVTPAAGMARRTVFLGLLTVVFAPLGHTPQALITGFAAVAMLLHGVVASVRAAHRAIDG